MAATPTPNGQTIVNALRGVHEPSDRLIAMTRFITTKIDELAAVDARIEKRIEHLSRTEESLRNLFDALRQQVGTAYPLLEEIKTACDESRRVAHQLSAAAPPAPLAPTATQIAASRAAQAEESSELLASAIHECKTQITSEIEQSISAISIRATDAFNDHIAERVEDALAEIAQASANALPTADEIDAIAITNDNLHLQDQEDDALDRMRVMEQSVLAGTAQMDAMLEELAADFRKRCIEVLDNARRDANDRVDDLARSARVWVSPVVEQIEREQKSANAQLRAAADVASESLRQHASTLHVVGQSIVDAFEERLVQRVVSLKPRAQERVALVEQGLRDRIDRLIESADSWIASREQAITARVDNLRPRVMNGLRSLEDDIRTQVEQLETQAESMTAFLEQKLNDRIEQRVQELRQLAKNELNPPQPSKDLKSELASPLSGKDVKVELFVEQIKQWKEGSAQANGSTMHAAQPNAA